MIKRNVPAKRSSRLFESMWQFLVSPVRGNVPLCR